MACRARYYVPELAPAIGGPCLAARRRRNLSKVCDLGFLLQVVSHMPHSKRAWTEDDIAN
jgi:hypothetical protein